MPALVKALQKDLPWQAAMDALGRLGPAAEAAVPDLIQILEVDDRSEQRLAIDTLARIGAANRQTVPALVKALQKG